MNFGLYLAEEHHHNTFLFAIVIKMGWEASEAVFQQGKRLKPNDEGENQHISSGDGAWIMQKCARTMGGRCRISFERNCTVFSFHCPAEPLTVRDLPKTEEFEVPPGTWGIAIDDSMVQRRLMGRILSHAGVEESRRIILGAEPSDIPLMEEHMKKILKKDKGCKILVVVDENLDFAQRDLTHVIISGSQVMKDILQSLSPEEEARVFGLVRSANDSAEDVAMYLDRVHAFFPKAPMQRERVREILAPLWAERFLAQPKEVSRSKIRQDDWSVERDALLRSMSDVDKLVKDKSADHVPWQKLWSTLHRLKGDLMVLDTSEELALASMLISGMRGEETPRDFKAKWARIRKLVLRAAQSLR